MRSTKPWIGFCNLIQIYPQVDPGEALSVDHVISFFQIELGLKYLRMGQPQVNRGLLKGKRPDEQRHTPWCRQVSCVATAG